MNALIIITLFLDQIKTNGSYRAEDVFKGIINSTQETFLQDLSFQNFMKIFPYHLLMELIK